MSLQPSWNTVGNLRTHGLLGGWMILAVLLSLLLISSPFVAQADELSLTTSFTYNENDAVETVTTPDGVVATIDYDEVDRPVSVSYSQGAGGVSAITYTDLGQVASVTDTEGTIQFHYDPRLHGLTDVIYPAGGGSLHLAYDHLGRVINTRAGGAGSGESYRYDQEGRITQVSADHGATTVTHDPLTGRVSSVQLGSGTTESYTYDSVTGEVTTVTQRQPGGGLIAQYSYTYYANGLKESVTETSPERGTETVTYEYDELQRLSRAIYDLADLSQRIESYEYDANGNRLRRHVTLDNETVEDTRYRYNGLNQIVQAGNEVIYHNARGNIVKRVTPGAVLLETNYQWDSANRLVGVTKKENNQEVLGISYRYNALGQRIERSVSRPGHPLETKSYVNSSGELYQPLKIEDGGGTTVMYPGGNAYQRGGKVRYELGGIGGVTRVLGGNGQLVASYRYDAFGRILESEGEAEGERTKRYQGEDWDEEAGLQYLRNRYYDPDLGRFLSVDPHPGFATKPQTLNPYVYCHNDPVNFADPTGLCELFSWETGSYWGDVGEFYKGYWNGAKGSVVAAWTMVSNPGETVTGLVYMANNPGEAWGAIRSDYQTKMQSNAGQGEILFGILTSIPSGGGGAIKTVGLLGDISSATRRMGGAADGMVDLYRAVSPGEFADVFSIGGFRPSPGGGSLVGKQFGHSLDEVIRLADFLPDTAAIVKARIPKVVFDKLDHTPVDSFILRSGSSTVQLDQLDLFNGSIISLIHAY